MIDRFEIIGHDDPRPEAERIIFCDGTGGSLFRAETDLELSHWRPNRTPNEYRAGTSTEICFRFLDNPRPGSWTVAVNNHVDVDGILSVYVLVHSRSCLGPPPNDHRGRRDGRLLGLGRASRHNGSFKGITQIMERGETGKAIYAEAFRRIPALIDGTDPELSQIEDSLTPLRQGVELVEQGKIIRSPIGSRLAQYIVPLAVAGDDDDRASYVPEFNEAISPKAILWPQVRARWDAERVCLVSTERKTGWFHDLWFPGYLWADTEGKWLVPGMTYDDGMGSYKINNPRLVAAFDQLQRQETAPGRWALGRRRTSRPVPAGGSIPRRRGLPAVSQLSPDQVGRTLDGVFG